MGGYKKMQYKEILCEVVKKINSFSPKVITEMEITKVSFKDLAMDSLSYISLLVSIEDLYGFRFEDKYLLPQAFSNIDEFIQYIVCKLAEQKGKTLHCK